MGFGRLAEIRNQLVTFITMVLWVCICPILYKAEWATTTSSKPSICVRAFVSCDLKLTVYSTFSAGISGGLETPLKAEGK